MEANKNAVDGANATALVRLAQHCAVAGVRLSRTARIIITMVHVKT